MYPYFPSPCGHDPYCHAPYWRCGRCATWQALTDLLVVLVLAAIFLYAGKQLPPLR